jgi:hypothetical protein
MIRIFHNLTSRQKLTDTQASNVIDPDSLYGRALVQQGKFSALQHMHAEALSVQAARDMDIAGPLKVFCCKKYVNSKDQH